MIQFKHFAKSSVVGSGPFVFRQYKGAETKSRFAQFIEGTIKELGPEDFEGITTIKSYAFCDFSNLERLDMGDSVTSIEAYGLDVRNPNLKEIIFSANLTSIGDTIFVDLVSGGNSINPSSVILDFSRAKQVPTLTEITSDGANDPFSADWITEVKVPQGLYDGWISSNWRYSKCLSKIIAV